MISISSIFREKRILLLFDFSMTYYQQALEASYGKDMSASVVAACRRQFKEIIPKIPDLGCRMLFYNIVLESFALDLALFKVLQEYNISPKDSAEIGMEAMEIRLREIPPIIRKLIGHYWFSKTNIRNIKKQSAEQQLRHHPGNWVGKFVEGDGREFDWGLDFTECGAWKFMQSMGGMELSRYLCNYDHLLSNYLHWGLKRTTRIATGCDKCNFRYKKPC